MVTLAHRKETTMAYRRFWVTAAALLALLAATPATFAVITYLVPMQTVLKDSTFIVTAKVDTLDKDKLTTIFVVDEDLKGKLPHRKLLINLTGDSEAKKDDHTGKLLKRLAPKMNVVLFVMSRGADYHVFAYSNGTWFHLIAAKAGDPEKTVFAFTHCEPYLTRTFKGTTEEMKKVVVDGLSGKAKPPEPNVKEPPGFGPEVMPEEKGKPGNTGVMLLARFPACGKQVKVGVCSESRLRLSNPQLVAKPQATHETDS
jgi:hypothetical protein